MYLSPHVLTNLERVLIDQDGGLGWPAVVARQYTEVLREIAYGNGGGVIEPVVSVSDCLVDYEDNRILELALASGSFLIISTDKHLLDMSPWRGTPIITPADFVFRVSAMRQAKRA